jgi:hypothetical protein
MTCDVYVVVECHYKLRKVPTNDQTMSVSWLQESFKAVFGHFRPGTHQASYKMGTGSFPEVKRPGRGVGHSPHLGPRLKKD